MNAIVRRQREHISVNGDTISLSTGRMFRNPKEDVDIGILKARYTGACIEGDNLK